VHLNVEPAAEAAYWCSTSMAPQPPLFQPFRALGYITDDVPFAVQRRGREVYVTVSVGKCWQARPVSAWAWWMMPDVLIRGQRERNFVPDHF
jgi:hypothetical protein